MATYRFGHDEFLIEGYSHARPFASFLPGIAGLWGVPMWVFYVNRGQAIAGFGIQDKEHPIMEFLPANRAYRTIPLHGFRTFLKFPGRRGEVYEPFGLTHSKPDGSTARRRMRIRMHELILEETHRRLGLETRVQYFTIPNEPVAALARVVSITNHSRAERPPHGGGGAGPPPRGARAVFPAQGGAARPPWGGADSSRELLRRHRHGA